MARKDTLRVTISPPLQQSIGMEGGGKEVDYFTLFGLERRTHDEQTVGDAVLRLSQKLREWQSSPQYGDEVVELLRVVQRAAKILKEPRRCAAYIKELQRIESGKARNAIDEFTDLVRAAIGDGVISLEARNELTLYAQKLGLTQADATRITQRVRDEIRARREAAPAPEQQKEEWEFHLAEEGEETFMLEMQGLENSGRFGDQTSGYLLTQASKYGLPPDRAATLIAQFQRVRFRNTVERVAGSGVINDAQARLILAKSGSYGLSNKEAYEIISDYTLSAYGTDEMLQVLAAGTFEAGEIKELVGDETSAAAPPSRPRRRKSANVGIPAAAVRNIMLVVVVGLILLAVATYGPELISRGGDDGGQGSQVQDATPIAAIQPTDAIVADNDVASPDFTPEPTPTETPETSAAPQLETLPDPASGMLLFEPRDDNDPAAFEMLITEVSNYQFQAFLRATLEPAPPGWGDNYAIPDNRPYMPVVNVTWQQAQDYCVWLQRDLNLPVGSVRLPTHEEFMRALSSGPTIRGNPAAADFWERARLGQATAPSRVATGRWDKIFVQGRGQIYDLVGNVAEWGQDSRGNQRLVLGGDFQQDAPGFDPREPRWIPLDTVSPAIGFRYVYAPRP